MRNELEIVLIAAQDMPLEQLPKLLGELAEVQYTAMARLTVSPPATQQHDELLGIEAAAERLGVSKDYLYRNHSKFSFTRRIGKRLLFSSIGIDRHIRQSR